MRNDAAGREGEMSQGLDEGQRCSRCGGDGISPFAPNESTGAKTENTGQLNPAFSLWLMGLPAEWACLGGLAMRFVRLKRKRSSKAI